MIAKRLCRTCASQTSRPAAYTLWAQDMCIIHFTEERPLTCPSSNVQVPQSRWGENAQRPRRTLISILILNRKSNKNNRNLHLRTAHARATNRLVSTGQGDLTKFNSKMFPMSLCACQSVALPKNGQNFYIFQTYQQSIAEAALSQTCAVGVWQQSVGPDLIRYKQVSRPSRCWILAGWLKRRFFYF